MATNAGYEILVASTVAADTKSAILKRVLNVTKHRTRTLTYAATYSAGTTSTNGVSIEVGGTSEDYGIRVVFDTAVVGTTTGALILAKLISAVRDQTLTLTHHATAYTVGNRAYNVTVTLT